MFTALSCQDGATSMNTVTFDIASSISLICCARMLLNIRDIMTLSDPRDTTKPNPWSLDASFDVFYGLGGTHEVILEYGSSNIYNTGLFVSDGQLMHADPIGGPPSSPRMTSSSLLGPGASSDHATRRSQGKLKARD